MKLTLLAPLLLSSTAFAGVGRWRRQDAVIVCRPGTAGDCPADQTCQFVTRNPERPGYDGACRAAAPASSSSSAPAPGPSVVICRDDNDCTASQRCQFVTRNPERPGYDGACVERGSSSSSSAGPQPSNGACTVNTDCPETQYCDSSASSGPSTCVNYRDCRFMGCPGGTCVAQSNDPNIDKRSQYEPFQCSFASVPPSSSAPSGSASSVSSVSSSTSSSAPSSMPSDVTLCRDDSECTDSQFCRYVTRNLDGSGRNGACTTFSDCRGPIGCGSDKGAQVCQPSAYKPGIYYKDPTVNFVCVAADCRTAGCQKTETCTYFNKGLLNEFLCIPNADLPAAKDCRESGCPGGQCGFNGEYFQCYFNMTSSSSSMPPPSSSASKSDAGPTKSAEPTSKAGPTESAHPAPAPAPEPHPAPPASSSAAPAPAPKPDNHPAPPASSSPAPPPPAPAPMPPKKEDKCKVDYEELICLLKDIKAELDCIKKDVEDIKCKLGI